MERCLGRRPITALGNLDLIRSRPLALFCSVKCPGDVILRTYDLIRALRDAGAAVIGGFHSPMEKECLALLLRGTQPILICPARSIEQMRLPAAWKQPLAEGRLLVLSAFARKQRRVTAETSETRNAFVAALADRILIAYAAPGGRTEGNCRNLLALGKTVWTLDSKENARLIALGVRPIRDDRLGELLDRSREMGHRELAPNTS